MNTIPSAEQERQTAIADNTGGLWAYNFMAFALLLDASYRALVYGEAVWDLLALVVVGGAICAGCQSRQNVWAELWAMRKLWLLIACVAAILAAAVTLLQR